MNIKEINYRKNRKKKNLFFFFLIENQILHESIDVYKTNIDVQFIWSYCFDTFDGKCIFELCCFYFIALHWCRGITGDKYYYIMNWVLIRKTHFGYLLIYSLSFYVHQ